jgi:23S rRNA pseudouridine1911/1915/1917 synthase
MKFDIMFEDNHLIVAVKPRNVASQEDASGDVCFVDMIKGYIKEKYEKTGNVYLGLVHRLDRPTGGIMVFARTSKAAERLSEAMREGEFDKGYLAVVHGTPKEKFGRLVHYLLKNEAKNSVFVVPASTDGAKRAELTYRVKQTKGNLSLVEIRLITGRSHQARVQMAAIGHSIFGDFRYGKAEPKPTDLALFAYELKFPHPITEKTMVFRATPGVDGVWEQFDTEQILTI